MATVSEESKKADRGYYDASYSEFSSVLYSDIRREAYGEDLGQNSWMTNDELAMFIDWLRLKPGDFLLDVACGSGGPTIRVAKMTGCASVGIDLHEQAVSNANALAKAHTLTDRVHFELQDANQPLPFPTSSFDAVMCIDAVNHLRDRARVFGEWARVLKPAGRMLFTDPIVVTGYLSNEEIALRSSIGFFLFVPRGENERLLEAAGLKSIVTRDLTENVADVARRRSDARAARESILREVEGGVTYERQQEFLRMARMLARERRLSRLAYLAAKSMYVLSSPGNRSAGFQPA